MNGFELDESSFAALVDHTLLTAEATKAQIVALCAEAVELTTASVCVNGRWTATVAAELAGSPVKTCSVVGFPLGAMSAASVAFETADVVDHGAQEIDMVQPIGPLIAGDLAAVGDVIAAVRRAGEGRVLKVILETACLSDDQIVDACRVAVDNGADFVKTSTGFHPSGGASAHAVELMRGAVGPDVGVKASGGIRTLADVERMIAAGANRLGMSATAAVVAELRA